jgi:hypothetical protein
MTGMTKPTNEIPKEAVLLIPEPEANEPAPYGVKPGYYNSKEMLRLLDLHKNNKDAIHFIVCV